MAEATAGQQTRFQAPVHLHPASADVMARVATLATLGATAALVARAASRGLFTAARYRDATGIGRTLALQRKHWGWPAESRSNPVGSSYFALLCKQRQRRGK